jgi:hypothetical protein
VGFEEIAVHKIKLNWVAPTHTIIIHAWFVSFKLEKKGVQVIYIDSMELL